MRTIRFADGRTFDEFEPAALEAFVGDVHDFDMDAIEDQATTIIVHGGRPVRVWSVDSNELSAICANNRVYGWTCPDDGARLEWNGYGWTCPHCGCYTSSPAADACTPLYMPTDAPAVRFSGNYEDVFIEDDHFLYACTDAASWGYGYAVNEYRVPGYAASSVISMTATRDAVNLEFMRGDTCDADDKYLRTLKHAPLNITRAVIMAETRRAAYIEDIDDDEKAEYIGYTLERLDQEIAELA